MQQILNFHCRISRLVHCRLHRNELRDTLSTCCQHDSRRPRDGGAAGAALCSAATCAIAQAAVGGAYWFAAVGCALDALCVAASFVRLYESRARCGVTRVAYRQLAKYAGSGFAW